MFFCAFGLRYLNLSRCHLEDQTTYLLGDCLSTNETIKNLNLSKNKISDAGFRSFQNLLSSNSTLENLDLSCNFISEVTAIEFISNAEFNTSLKYLNLYDNQISNDIGKYILRILDRNKTLMKINLIFNRVQLKTIEEINEKLKINSIKERKKYVPNIERTLRDLAFDPKEFKVLTRQIKSKKEQEILISKKIKSEQKYYAELINKEYKLVNKKKLEVKEVEEKLKKMDKKISDSSENMKLIEENLLINENKIKNQIKKELHGKSDLDMLNIKAKADYELVKKEMEDIINKTRIKYGESQDKILDAQKSLSKLNLHLKKMNKLLENLNNPHKLVKITKKETTKGKEFNRRKSQFIKKISELDVNKININIDNKDQDKKEKNTITNSTSPTIQDVKKRTKRKTII